MIAIACDAMTILPTTLMMMMMTMMEILFIYIYIPPTLHTLELYKMYYWIIPHIPEECDYVKLNSHNTEKFHVLQCSAVSCELN